MDKIKKWIRDQWFWLRFYWLWRQLNDGEHREYLNDLKYSIWQKNTIPDKISPYHRKIVSSK
jgi:hypothetical protein